MRLLMLSNIFPPGFVGGYELAALDVARGLISRGHEVEVLTSNYLMDDEGELSFRVDRVLQCGFITRSPSERVALESHHPYIMPSNIRHLVSALIRFQPHRVLCFNISMIGPAGVLHYLTAVGYRPTLFLMDDIFGHFGYGQDVNNCTMYERTFGQHSWIDKVDYVFMSRNVRAQVEASLSRTLPNGCIIPGWFGPTVGTAFTGRESISPEPPTKFIFASRIGVHKGIEIVLHATRAVLDCGYDRFTVDLAGNGDVGPTLHRIHALKLQDHVTYLGELPKADLLSRYSDYDALLFPTWPREPFGLVVSEAAAAGCLPIMTAGIGASEWFLDGIDSLKISRTADHLAAAMIRLIVMPAAERGIMRSRACATARRFFDFENALASIETLLLKGETPPMIAVPQELRAVEASLEVLTEFWRGGCNG